MTYSESIEKISEYRLQISELRKKMRELQTSVEPEIIQDYEFATTDGPVKLSQLFGDKDTLFVVHNMGASCPYCTLWADGFNGIIDHLENRAAFVISSPDEPSQQKDFADKRNWRFRFVSHGSSSFTEDMGYKAETHWMPGVSVFKKSDGKIIRVSDTSFGPGDDFCSAWHLFDLIPEGTDGWQPQYKYS
ncbi:MAG: DUF899 family protein [Methyloligellaceae bacterium]